MEPLTRWRSLRRFVRNPLGVTALGLIGALVLIAVFAPGIVLHDWNEQNLDQRLRPPAWAEEGTRLYPLGTDALGRDILSRIIYGARVSLVVGVATVMVGGLTGSTLGLVSGYLGGFWGKVIMRLADTQLAFPYMLLAIALMAVLGPSLRNVILVLGLSSWPTYARVMRGQVLSLKEREFVEASWALGASRWRIAGQHILPNAISPVIVITTLEVGRMIIAEASLSFLGLGVPLSIPTWGGMLSDGRSYLYDAWWMATFPGIAILLTVLAVNLFGDSLRDLFDPRA